MNNLSILGFLDQNTYMCPRLDVPGYLDIPDVGAVVPGEVPHLCHAERHRPDAEVELLLVQGVEHQVLGSIVVSTVSIMVSTS